MIFNGEKKKKVKRVNKKECERQRRYVQEKEEGKDFCFSVFQTFARCSDVKEGEEGSALGKGKLLGI